MDAKSNDDAILAGILNNVLPISKSADQSIIHMRFRDGQRSLH